MKPSISLVLLTALFCVGSLQAQTVWRCGEGGTRYSDSPCADGRQVAVADSRSSEDVAAARAVAANDRALADRLTRDRLAREASFSGELAAIRLPAPLPAASPSSAKKAKDSPRKAPPKPFTVRLAKRSA